jgi:hypothetical protein
MDIVIQEKHIGYVKRFLLGAGIIVGALAAIYFGMTVKISGTPLIAWVFLSLILAFIGIWACWAAYSLGNAILGEDYGNSD